MFGVTNSRRERDNIALRGEIVGLFKIVKTVRQICEATGVAPKTARKWIIR